MCAPCDPAVETKEMCVDAPPVLRLDIMTKLREKTIEQLKSVLALRGDDEKKDGKPENDDKSEEAEEKQQSSSTNLDDVTAEKATVEPIDALARAIEIEIMRLCGNVWRTKRSYDVRSFRWRESRVQEQVEDVVF